jgi:hypothetical protein
MRAHRPVRHCTTSKAPQAEGGISRRHTHVKGAVAALAGLLHAQTYARSQPAMDLHVTRKQSAPSAPQGKQKKKRGDVLPVFT